MKLGEGGVLLDMHYICKYRKQEFAPDILLGENKYGLKTSRAVWNGRRKIFACMWWQGQEACKLCSISLAALQ